jgi:serine/threonine protein kinase
MSQSKIEIIKKCVCKQYYDNKKNRLSSVKMELAMIDRFKSRHAPEIISRFDNGYYMKRYDYALGTTKKLNRFCPNFLDEINEIERDLINSRINHRDINPGNLLYCEDEHSLILIDFYWAISLEMSKIRIGKLNKYYGNDRDAFERLRREYGKNHL